MQLAGNPPRKSVAVKFKEGNTATSVYIAGKFDQNCRFFRLFAVSF